MSSGDWGERELVPVGGTGQVLNSASGWCGILRERSEETRKDSSGKKND